MIPQHGAVQVFLPPVVVDGRTVGENDGCVEGDALLGDLGRKGVMGSTGCHGEPAAFADEILNGAAIAVGNLKSGIIQGIVQEMPYP